MNQERADAAKAAWEAYVTEISTACENKIADIVRPLARGWVQQGGDTYKCLSPLRSEKTASFYVYVGRGWFDYGTYEGGTALQFLRLKYGGSWREAVDRGAALVGIEPWEERKKRVLGSSGGAGGARMTNEELDTLWHQEAERTRVFDAMTALQHLAHALLPDKVRAQLTGHYGLTDEFIDFEKIGFVPSAFWEIATHRTIAHFDGAEHPNPFCLLDKFTEDELLSTGWFHRTQSGVVSCVFEHRIVFPYWERAHCKYVIGREFFGPVPKDQVTLEEYEKGKYKKLPLFDPRKRPYVSPHLTNVLWGTDTLRYMTDGALVVTEGMTDAQMLAQLGFAVISPITVQFKKGDIELVRSICRAHKIQRVTILNDADVLEDGRQPGLEGAKKMAEALSDIVDVRIGRLPKPEGVAKVDVNELGAAKLREVGEDGARAFFVGLIAQAKSFVDFLIDDLDPNASVDALDTAIRTIGKFSASSAPLARSARVTLLRTKLPGFPRGPLARTFDAGVAEGTIEHAEQKRREAEAAAEDEPDKKPSRIDTAGLLRGTVIEDIGGYECVNPTGSTDVISNFALVLVELAVQSEGPAWYVVRVWKDGDTVVSQWAIPPRAWTSKRAFLSAFPISGMVFTGSDDNVQGLHALLSEKERAVPRLTLTNVIGRHEAGSRAPRFVLPQGVLSADGWMTSPDFLYEVEGGSASLGRKMGDVRSVPLSGAEGAEKSEELVRTFLTEAPTLHEPISAAVALGWMTAALFREPWGRRHAGAFPILNVYGRPGSGKSSFFARFLWPAFAGVERSEPIGCTATPFAMIRDLASTNAIAQMFDEFKSDMGIRQLEQLLRFLRRAYAGEDETRGRADQSVSRYPMVAPVCVLGETRLSDDQALHERCVFLSLPGRFLASHPEVAERFRAAMALPLWRVAPLLWQWSLGADVDTLAAEAEALATGALAQLDRATLPLRMRYMVETVLFGLLAFDAACVRFGAPVPQTNPLAVVRRLLAESLEEDEAALHVVGAPRAQPLDSLDLWLRSAAELAALGVVVEGTHFFWIDERLHLLVSGIDAEMTKWFNDHGRVRHSPGPGSLVRMAREKREAEGEASFVIKHRKRVRPSTTSEHRVWCLALDVNRAPEALELRGFPCEHPRSYGGIRPRDPLLGWKLDHESDPDEDK